MDHSEFSGVRWAGLALAGWMIVLGGKAQSQDGLVGADFPAAKYATLPNGVRFDVTDVDGDGMEDLLSASRLNADGGAFVLFGRGDGTFEPALKLAFPERLEDAAAIDLDGDGDLEIVLTAQSAGEVYLQENLGGRSFGPPQLIATAAGPGDIALADANGDGGLDVLVGIPGSAQVLVFLKDGLGGLVPAAPLGVGRVPDRIEVGDVDGDGRDDLLVANFIGPAFDLLRGTPGGFGPAETITVGPSVRKPVLRDGNGDGVLDLAFVEWNADGVFFMPGNGDGTFGTPLRTEAGESPQSVEVADLDADGVPDFIVTRESSGGQVGGRLVVIGGDPALTFGVVGPAIRTGSNPRSTMVRDFDGDGHLDVAALNNIGGDIAILRGRGDLTLEVPLQIPVGSIQPESILAGDFTGDGLDDILVCDAESGNMRVFAGDGTGGFSGGATSATEVHCFAARAADLDGDGDLDAVLQGRRNGFPGELAVALNDGGGIFTVSDRHPHDQETARQLEVGDIDGDGLMDIVTTGFFGRIVSWIGEGDGTFVPGPTGGFFQTARFLDLGDVNGDGFLDVVAADTGDRRIDTYLGDGAGLFTLSFDVPTSFFGAGHLRLGDLNGDGAIDLVVSGLIGSSGSGIAVFEGNGDGTFVPGDTRETRNDPSGLRIEDVDLDGRNEIIVVASTAVSDLEVVELSEVGAPVASTLYSGSLRAGDVAVGDFDDDGNPDLALASNNARTVTVLMNRADVRLNGYCTTFANSTGSPARLTAEGSRSLVANDLTLSASHMPAGETLVWFAGGTPGNRVMLGANLCIAGPLERISSPGTIAPDGAASLEMALTPLLLTPGDTWYFQAWFTDQAGAAPQFNFTNGLAVLLRP